MDYRRSKPATATNRLRISACAIRAITRRRSRRVRNIRRKLTGEKTMSSALVPMNEIERMAQAVAKSGLFGVNGIAQSRNLVRRIVFQKKVLMSGCFIWTGSCGNSGYGKLRVGHSKDFSAHRVAYGVFYGKIPDGMCVLHKCDVRRCINPRHLFLGTKRDNTLDMVRKGRHVSPPSLRTHCPQGHEYSGVNSKGARICGICQRAARLAHYHRSKNEHSNSASSN